MGEYAVREDNMTTDFCEQQQPTQLSSSFAEVSQRLAHLENQQSLLSGTAPSDPAENLRNGQRTILLETARPYRDLYVVRDFEQESDDMESGYSSDGESRGEVTDNRHAGNWSFANGESTAAKNMKNVNYVLRNPWLEIQRSYRRFDAIGITEEDRDPGYESENESRSEFAENIGGGYKTLCNIVIDVFYRMGRISVMLRNLPATFKNEENKCGSQEALKTKSKSTHNRNNLDLSKSATKDAERTGKSIFSKTDSRRAAEARVDVASCRDHRADDNRRTEVSDALENDSHNDSSDTENLGRPTASDMDIDSEVAEETNEMPCSSQEQSLKEEYCPQSTDVVTNMTWTTSEV